MHENNRSGIHKAAGWRAFASGASRAVILSTGLIFGSQACFAQIGAGGADPKACASGERLQRGSGNPSAGANAQSDSSLSEKLARTDGVICPPANVDPEIAAPPPGGGKTPVIPPPGSPGGDQSVQPK